MTQYYSKLAITGSVDIHSGLHIGASTAFSAIGATDSPVIKGSLSGLPIIPGSSLKGKLRTLLAKSKNQEIAQNPNQDAREIRQLFGDSEEVKVGRLLFRDLELINYEELMQRGADTVTEVKFENSINRLTAIANPRQIERVIPGARFGLEVIYDYHNLRGNDYEKEILTDIQLLIDGMKLLEFDYLGGNGSRGYGKVSFEGCGIKQVIGNLPEEFVAELNNLFK